MKRKRILVILTILFIAGFTFLGISNLRNQAHQIQLKEIKLKNVDNQLKLERIKTDKLQKELNNGQVKSQAEIDRLNKEVEERKQNEQRLEAELQAKLQRKEQERIVAAQLGEKAINTITGTATVSAQSARGGNCLAIQEKLARLGVPENQLAAAGQLAMRESSCNEHIVNSIGACGAFQSLPCGKWGSPGTDQYYLGAIAYANGRYGGYNQALAFSLANNWY